MASNKLKRAMLDLLLRESFPWVTVDTSHPGVDVPANLRVHGSFTNFRLTFEQGPQIPDLKLTDDGWTATLAFGPGNTYFVVIPWDACVQFGDGPADSYAIVWKRPEKVEEDAPVAPVTRLKPKFGVVKGDKA